MTSMPATDNTAAVTDADTLVVLVQDQSQFSHVVVERHTGTNNLANAWLTVTDLLADMEGCEVDRQATGADFGQVDIDGQMVLGYLVTNPGTDELSLVAIAREF